MTTLHRSFWTCLILLVAYFKNSYTISIQDILDSNQKVGLNIGYLKYLSLDTVQVKFQTAINQGISIFQYFEIHG